MECNRISKSKMAPKKCLGTAAHLKSKMYIGQKGASYVLNISIVEVFKISLPFHHPSKTVMQVMAT